MPTSLSQQVATDPNQMMGQGNEGMWIEVIQKMDDVYADLLHYQVELEEKNVALEEAQQFIRGVLASMTDVLVVCDLSGFIQQSNKASSELFGRNESSLVGTSISNLFDESSQSTLATCLDKARLGMSEEHEVLVVDEQGHVSPLLIRCSPQFDHEGALIGMVLIGRPIGELRLAYNELNQTHVELQKAQNQLVQSEKMASLGRLVAGVAHELNNPISFVHSNMFAIKKYGYRLREYIDELHKKTDHEDCEAMRENLKIDRILDDIPSLVDGGLEGTMRVSSIVQDLRRYSTSHREQTSEFNLLEIVQNAAKWVTKASRIQAKLSIEGEEIIVRSYEGFVHQVVVNLIQNSLDAMERERERKIDVRCFKQGNHAKITIHDYGGGISDEHLLQIFDPFFTTKEIGKGTGLGLYVSYGLIVEQCGGTMTAENHPDGGAMFTVSLPLDEGEESAS